MNILYLTNHLNIGGITSYVFLLARALKERGHNIYIASSGGECLEKFKHAQINYIPIPIRTKKELSPKILFSALKLRPVILESKIDIIHANSRTTAVLGCLLGDKTNAAFVSTCHGFFKPRFLRKIWPCWGKRIIAISQEVRQHLISDFRVSPDKISVIHHGIDVDKYRGQNREDRIQKKKELGLSEGPVIGIIARLSDVKGHVYLVRAMKDVLQKIPDAQLLIVGDGRQKGRIEKAVAKLDLRKSIFLIPSDPFVPKALSAMDIFVLPSLKEGLGLSLMEAMAAGKPVIGSDIGGIRSLIQDGVNGLLVKAGDSCAIAAAILDLLGSPQKRERMGVEASNFIRQNFSLEQMIVETERFYAECLK